MPLTPIRLMTTQFVDGHKYDKVTTESGVVSYFVDGKAVSVDQWGEYFGSNSTPPVSQELEKEKRD